MNQIWLDMLLSIVFCMVAGIPLWVTIVQYCCERYSVVSHSTLCSYSVIQRACYSRYTRDDYNRTLFVLELMMLRLGILNVGLFNMHEITEIINYVCSF